MQTPKLQKLLYQFETGKDWETKMLAAERLGVYLAGRSAPSALIRGLRDHDELVRVATAEALGEIGDKKSLPSLWAAIDDVSPIVRREIAIAVGRMRSKSNVPRLMRQRQKDRSPAARVGYYYALYSCGENVLPDLLTLLNYKRDYHVRCATAHVLAHYVAKGNTLPADLPGVP